jgi:hypothetical protein
MNAGLVAALPDHMVKGSEDPEQVKASSASRSSARAAAESEPLRDQKDNDWTSAVAGSALSSSSSQLPGRYGRPRARAGKSRYLERSISKSG